jgi:hypothetical protein
MYNSSSRESNREAAKKIGENWRIAIIFEMCKRTGVERSRAGKGVPRTNEMRVRLIIRLPKRFEIDNRAVKKANQRIAIVRCLLTIIVRTMR